jgi:hypothetical protein
VGIFDQFLFFFKTDGTKTNTCGGIKVYCVKWALVPVIMVPHILGLQMEQVAVWIGG